MASLLITILDFLYFAIFILLIGRFILSISQIGPYQLRDWVFRLTEPLLAPIRRLLPSRSGVDFSPMILLLGIWLLRVFIQGFLT